MTQTYESLCQMLKKEIKTIEQQPALTKESLELLKSITETMSNIKHIMKMEEEKEKEKEMGGMSSRGGSSYENMMSNAQRRDSMGRYMDYNPNPMMMYDMNMANAYARGGNSNNAYARGGGNSNDNSYARGGNSNDNSYARGGSSRDYDSYSRDDSRKKMVRKLETLMDDTMSEKERQAIQECMNKIDQ